MTLSPEERRRIYEEEKAKVEVEKKKLPVEQSSMDLKPGTAGVLCYLGGWVTGIIFLILEQKNRRVRFHALQSIIVFGGLNILYALLRPVPLAGMFFGAVIGLVAFILWIVLMVKASQGEFCLPVAGNLAGKIQGPAQVSAAEQVSPQPVPAQPGLEERRSREQRRPDSGKAGRIAASAIAIALSIAVIIFLNFYHDYIAYYHMETIGGTSHWMHDPIVTSDFSSWLPVVNAALGFSIAGHIMLLVFDKYLLRETMLLVIDVFSIISIATLLYIFPFDFSVFGVSLEAPLDLSARITLVIIIFGFGIAALVRLIKILVNAIRGTATY